MLKPVLMSLAAAVALAPAALAAPITPDAAAEVLRGGGDTDVTVSWNGDTAARIDSNREGFRYSVSFFSCNEAKTCAGVMMFATFGEPGAADLAVYERVNSYNDSYPFGRGFVLAPEEADGTYTIGIDYTLDLSGEANFDAGDLDLFFSVVNAYLTHMEGAE